MFAILAALLNSFAPIIPALLGMFKVNPSAAADVATLLPAISSTVQAVEVAYADHGQGAGATKLAALHQVIQVVHSGMVANGTSTSTYDAIAPVVEQAVAIAVLKAKQPTSPVGIPFVN
jgi:uncharacterized membrane protein